MCVDCVGCLCHDLCIKSCCEVYEALNGRLIGSKAWNRGGKNVRDSSGQPVTVHGLIWVIDCAIM